MSYGKDESSLLGLLGVPGWLRGVLSILSIPGFLIVLFGFAALGQVIGFGVAMAVGYAPSFEGLKGVDIIWKAWGGFGGLGLLVAVAMLWQRWRPRLVARLRARREGRPYVAPPAVEEKRAPARESGSDLSLGTRLGCLVICALGALLMVVFAWTPIERGIHARRSEMTLEELISADDDPTDVTLTDFRLGPRWYSTWSRYGRGATDYYGYRPLLTPSDDGSGPVRAVLEVEPFDDEDFEPLWERIGATQRLEVMVAGRGSSCGPGHSSGQCLPDDFDEAVRREVDDRVVMLSYGTSATEEMWLGLCCGLPVALMLLGLGIGVYRR